MLLAMRRRRRTTPPPPSFFVCGTTRRGSSFKLMTTSRHIRGSTAAATWHTAPHAGPHCLSSDCMDEGLGLGWGGAVWGAAEDSSPISECSIIYMMIGDKCKLDLTRKPFLLHNLWHFHPPFLSLSSVFLATRLDCDHLWFGHLWHPTYDGRGALSPCILTR